MPHVLLIEDNPGDAVLISEMYQDRDAIGDEYAISHVLSVEDAVTILAEDNTIDAVLSDMTLPDSESLETIRTLTATAGNLPVIFMTGTNNEAFVKAAMRAGAQDYLVKDHIDPELLSRTTNYAIERKNAQNRLETADRKAVALVQSTELLKHQKRQLVSLNRAKDEFISLASHQLRTPATSVKQYLGMMLAGYAGEVPEHLTVFLRTAYDSNERQLNIINDLLKTAQLDSGRFELVKKQTDLNQLLQIIIDDYAAILTMRRQTVAYVPATVSAQVDPVEMKVALSNLLENASKYSPEQSLITIRLETGPKAVKIHFEDNGVGINKANVAKIFDKFVRLDNELSDTVSGSGLGLYFVKRIIKLHHGSITVKSKPGKGTIFIVLLPV